MINFESYINNNYSSITKKTWTDQIAKTKSLAQSRTIVIRTQYLKISHSELLQVVNPPTNKNEDKTRQVHIRKNNEEQMVLEIFKDIPLLDLSMWKLNHIHCIYSDASHNNCLLMWKILMVLN